jgi:hypothetical protein
VEDGQRGSPRGLK